MSRKIVALLVGGLGNQLFIYAAARRLALISGAELVIDDVSGFSRDVVYRRKCVLRQFNTSYRSATRWERLEPFSRIRRRALRSLNSKRLHSERSYLSEESLDFDPRILELRPTGPLYLEGYWQSERYFQGFESTIRSDLRMISPSEAVYQQLAEQARSGLSIALHVRFFEGVSNKNLSNARWAYYRRAMNLVEQMVGSGHYFVFSDVPAAIPEKLDLPQSRYTLIDKSRGDGSAYLDFWLMQQCRHFIIADSTFSWWAAWLADSQEKLVIAPKASLQPGYAGWGFHGLLPDKWIAL